MSSLDADLNHLDELLSALPQKNFPMTLSEFDGYATGDTPALAPVCDMLSTFPYIPTDGLALSLGGERAFKGLTQARWKAFANRARLPEPAVLKAVTETVKHIDAKWWTLPEREVLRQPVLERIDAHVKTMIPILND